MKSRRTCFSKVLWLGVIAFAMHPVSACAEETVLVESNLVYDTAIDCTGTNVALSLDAYYVNSMQTNRPVVILAHGGGFKGGDKGYTRFQGSFYPDLARAFATNGFVAFSINYRLNFSDVTQELDAAVEDVMNALSWIRAHRAGYGIDASKVLIAGDSAGGGLAINAAYRSTNSNSFLGCISLWGGVPPYGGDVHPVNTCPIMPQTPPTCLIHGTDDPVVPYVISDSLSSNLTAAAIYSELHPLAEYGHYPVMDDGVYNTNLVTEIFSYMIRFSRRMSGNMQTAIPVRMGGQRLQAENGTFIFDLTGPTDIFVVVEQSTDQMTTWQTISTNRLFEGSALVSNTVSATCRFYRARIASP